MKKQLLLLHGALGAKSQLQPLADNLKNSFEIHTLNFSGHGGEPVPAEPFSIHLFANDVLNYIEKHLPLTKGETQRGSENKISVFGYSMGGYVALYLAKRHPNLIDKIFTIATKFDWSPEIAAKETAMLNPEKIQQKIPSFAEELMKRHFTHPSTSGRGEGGEGNWKTVLSKTSEMMTNLGNNPELTYNEMKSINIPVIVSVGDSDKMVSIEETTHASNSLPNGKLLILPGTPHPLEKIPLDVLTEEIINFLQ